MTNMTIAKIKKEMLAYRDFHGGDLLKVGEVESATTKEELQEILNDHIDYLEDQLSDAISHIEHFRKKVGLNIF